jgi:hypothetical protein
VTLTFGPYLRTRTRTARAGPPRQTPNVVTTPTMKDNEAKLQRSSGFEFLDEMRAHGYLTSEAGSRGATLWNVGPVVVPAREEDAEDNDGEF